MATSFGMVATYNYLTKLPSAQVCPLGSWITSPVRSAHDAPTTAEPGLRERKKAATRQALHEAAVRLAIAHGPDRITVEAVADEAGVSRRTFSNYFANKEEALLLRRPAADARAGRASSGPARRTRSRGRR